MVQTAISIDLERVLGEVNPMIYGQYVEHVATDERCIYGALVDEPSELTDERGFRLDVAQAVRELATPVVRWPGGCFADIYHWEDGIGPLEQRPVRRNWHWGGLESNRFGTDEFLAWCRMVDTAPYINFNLGTGTLDEAIRWLDYCNGREETYEVRLRQQYGQQEPYAVKLWGIGNEQWGSWEAGHMDANTYAAKLHNWAQFLRKLDPEAQFLGIGSNTASDPDWDVTVLKKAGHLIEYLTAHIYGHHLEGVTTDEEYYAVVTNPVFFEDRLRQLAQIIESVMGGRDAMPMISVDEWNIRHMSRDEQGNLYVNRTCPRTLSDTLFAAGVLNAMLRLSAHVAMGCYVFLLNGNGVILTDRQGLLKTPFFDLFQGYRKHLLSTTLDARVTGEKFLTPVRQGHWETAPRDVDYVDVVATRDEGRRTLALALINRHRTQSASVRVVPEHFSCAPRADVWEMYHEDAFACNDATNPDRVRLQHRACDWSGSLDLQPHSLTIVRVEISR
jgi:alpha-N-arabinofuranosidase